MQTLGFTGHFLSIGMSGCFIMSTCCILTDNMFHFTVEKARLENLSNVHGVTQVVSRCKLSRNSPHPRFKSFPPAHRCCLIGVMSSSHMQGLFLQTCSCFFLGESSSGVNFLIWQTPVWSRETERLLLWLGTLYIYLPHIPGGQSFVTSHSTPEGLTFSPPGEYAAGRPAYATFTEHILIDDFGRFPVPNSVLGSKHTEMGRKFCSHWGSSVWIPPATRENLFTSLSHLSSAALLCKVLLASFHRWRDCYLKMLKIFKM